MHFGNLATFDQDEIRIGICVGIFDIIKVQHGRTFEDSAAYRSNPAANGIFLNRARRQQAIDGKPQGNPSAGNRGGACAAIGLQHVAIDGDLVFAQLLQIHDRA